MPTFYNYKCSACGFSCPVPSLYSAKHVYQLDAHSVAPVTCEEAWCTHCSGVVLRERLPGPGEIDALLKQLRDEVALLSSRSVDEFMKSVIDLEQRFLGSGAAWKRWATEQAGRSPRCLTCGGQTVGLTEQDFPGAGGRRETRFVHPGCTGTLTRHSGLHYSAKPPSRIRVVLFASDGLRMDAKAQNASADASGESRHDPRSSAQQERTPVTTSIHRSAFHILGVTARDDRRRIVEQAEEKSLSLDQAICQKARSELTNPRNRLAAEIGWVPGVSPRRAQKLLEQIVAAPRAIRIESGLPVLAHANLLAATFETVSEDHPPDDLANFILELADLVDSFDVDDIVRDINEDRSVSGFPEVAGADVVESELTERRRHYRNTIKDSLNRVAPAALIEVMTKVVEEATLHGADQAPGLVDDLVDSYELESQQFLEAEARNVERLIDAVREAAPSGEQSIRPLLDKLETVVRNWHRVVHPIQLSSAARGIKHPLSLKMASRLRGLSVDLFNEHDLLAVSKRLTALSHAVFAQLHDLNDQIAEDSQALSVIEAARRVEELLAPIVTMCKKVLEAVDNRPQFANEEANRLLDSARDALAALEREGAATEIVNRAKDCVATTVMQCAVAYGNKVEKWQACVALLERSAQLATDPEISERIAKNLEIVRRNQNLLGDLSPISSAPTLSTINGIGFTLYGRTDPDSNSGSYMATYYFVFLALPIFPLCRYRVVPTGGGYRFLGKGPLRPFDFAHIAVSVGMLIWMFAH